MSWFRQLTRLWAAAAGEMFKCLALGARDALSPGLLVRSAMLCIGVSVLWIVIYGRLSDQMLSLIGGLAVISVLGVVLGVLPGLAATQTGGSVAAMGNVGAGLLQVIQVLLVVAAFAAAIYVLLYLFAVTATVRGTLPRLLLPKAIAIVRRRSPPSETASMIRTQTAGRSRKRATLLLIAWLCVPVVAGCILLLGACYLNVRLLYSTVAKGTPCPELEIQRLDHRWRPLLLLGVVLTLLAAVPVLNLLVPGMMCTSLLHLVGRNNEEVLARCGVPLHS